ncbi:PAS domain S-box protein [Roseomonas sp. 18066]|uniref:PAS domain-containing sensor histidine kinase n=1 Tax=Roseomonas sp. 18066 TaxID=2681412 RepID=UPI001357BB72|nr:PAS domain S-box protein [Roseomonas sp. 18066]
MGAKARAAATRRGLLAELEQLRAQLAQVALSAAPPAGNGAGTGTGPDPALGWLLRDGATTLAVIATDAAGRVTGWNSGARLMLGWSTAEVLGQDIAMLWPPEARAAGQPAGELAEAREDGHAAAAHPCLTRDGQVLQVMGETLPLRDGAGAVSGYLKLLRDAAAGPQLPQALDRAAHRLRAMRQGLPLGIQELDAEGRYLSVSPPFQLLCGCDEASLLGRRFQELIADPAERPATEARFQALVEGETHGYLERRDHAAPGHRPFRAEIRMAALRDAEGRFVCALSMVEDITARAGHEDACRQLADLVEQSTDFLGIARLDFSAVYVNPSGLRLVGLPDLAAALQTSVLDYFPADQHDFLRRVVIPAVHEHGTWQGEMQFRSFATGELLPVWYNMLLMRDATGQICGYGTATRDLRELQRNEERLLALLQLGDRLRGLHDPSQIAVAAAEVIGRALGASRAGYAIIGQDGGSRVERDWTDGSVGHIAGQYGSAWRFADLWHRAEGAADAAAPVICVNDVADDPRTAAEAGAYAAIHVGAFMLVPVTAEGHAVAFLFLHDPTPREWSADEVGFARGAAERAWGAMERAAAEIRQMLMTRELNHRVKNTLAMVQAMALQTVRSATDLATFGPTFQARLIALARAHDLLTQTDWHGARLGEVVQTALATATGIHLDLHDCGDGEILNPAQALSLAMALHELTTNAVKHGALSRPGGHITVTCQVEPGRAAQLVRWVEQGGPPVASEPGRRGFGMRLLQRGLTGQSGMVARLDFLPDGLRCVLRFPLSAVPASFENQSAAGA